MNLGTLGENKSKLFKMLIVLSIFIIMTSYKSDGGTYDIDYVNSEKDLYVLDTIDICDPMLLKFIDNNDRIGMILISKERLDSINYKPSLTFKNFISSTDGYLFFPPNRFSCLLNNFINKNDVKSEYYLSLQDSIRVAHNDSIWVFNRNEVKEKTYKGWGYEEIYPRQFLICLVKGSALKLCQSTDEIPLESADNLYVKILVPITWSK